MSTRTVHFAVRLVITGLMLGAVACRGASPPAAAPQPPAPRATTLPSGQSPANQAVNDSIMRRVLERIADRAAAPAESVFRNVQWLKGIPARQLLSIMNGGYSAALGVTCAHCHVEGNFASDDKRPKRAAREMAVMHRAINTQLRQMTDLTTPTERRAINCSTCHRGAVNPMAPAR